MAHQNVGRLARRQKPLGTTSMTLEVMTNNATIMTKPLDFVHFVVRNVSQSSPGLKIALGRQRAAGTCRLVAARTKWTGNWTTVDKIR